MTRSIRSAAHAKINLFLEVTEKRADGYHEIDTVMHPVTLCDIITVTSVPNAKTNEIGITCDLKTLECDERNLAYRAAVLFFDAAKITKYGTVQIHIEKNIPIAAGLAGGSADAACVLRALNTLYETPLTEKELCSVGLSVGADVPFCIAELPSRCTGVGEIMEPCNELPECDIIITIKTGNKISTKEAYERIDFATNREIHMNLICEKLAEGDLGRITEKMYNAFSFTTPGIDKTIKKMMQQGSVGALMSGSGPAVFGLFNDHEKAVKACDFFTRNGYSAFLCKPLKKNMQNSKHIG